jgi:hypothetical protein
MNTDGKQRGGLSKAMPRIKFSAMIKGTLFLNEFHGWNNWA